MLNLIQGSFSMEYKNYQFCIESEQKALVDAFEKEKARALAAGESFN
jgi:hypothetical protein